MITRTHIPAVVLTVAETLENAGYEAYLVGGCVRDLVIGKTPKDWDITTNATPEQIQSLYSPDDTFCNNDFGTVGIVNDSVEDPTLKVIEVTPYRTESGYTDRRRPDQVIFGVTLQEDLQRRDFTVNALAWRPHDETLIDMFDGQGDIAKKRLKTVGKAADRFQEDALRMMRAVRLAAELNFAIESDTLNAIVAHHNLLKDIAIERVRDEFLRIIAAPTPLQGIVMLERLQILDYVLPELKDGIGCEQGGIHDFDVYEHNLRTCQAAADKGFSLELRLAGLLHDIGKPATRREGGKNKRYTFFGHEVVGAKKTRKIMQRLKIPRETAEKVEKLVRWHMFFSDPDEITLAAVRRTIVRIGEENIEDLLNLRVCDRIGTGRPKEQPFRFRKYKAMVDQARRDPISVKMLKTNGDHIMNKFGEKPGKKLGYVLHALLEDVLETPAHNTEEYLDNRTAELLALETSELEQLAQKGRDKQAAEEAEAIKSIERDHRVG